MKEKKKMGLGVRILLGMVLGIIVGAILWALLGVDKANEIATAYIKPFGDIFVNLLKYIVVPLVLLSIMDGVISMGDIGKVGKIGWKTVVYFLATTAVACVIGLVVANLFKGSFPVLSLAEDAAYEAKESDLIRSSRTSSRRTRCSRCWMRRCSRSSSLRCCSAAAFWSQARRASPLQRLFPRSTRSRRLSCPSS